MAIALISRKVSRMRFSKIYHAHISKLLFLIHVAEWRQIRRHCCCSEAVRLSLRRGPTRTKGQPLSCYVISACNEGPLVAECGCIYVLCGLASLTPNGGSEQMGILCPRITFILFGCCIGCQAPEQPSFFPQGILSVSIGTDRATKWLVPKCVPGLGQWSIIRNEYSVFGFQVGHRMGTVWAHARKRAYDTVVSP
ncbi:hypothetical protein SAMN04487955_12011 [Halomonas korlensis]|uniref:Uncharacterized protein n=1 Tax=Halomonas korlensis TaxID=463301 RepID=A0A1I7KGQ6_9GAMM|nr:hypothetical protein SAMN04487955_12011 [Halomonas korlensis]